MLTRLYADNFRCFVNFECRFGPQQLLVGPNGAGKTSLFDLFRRLRNACIIGWPIEGLPLEGHSPTDGFSPSTRTRWLGDDRSAQTFELDVEDHGGSYRFRLVIDSIGNPGRPGISHESVTFDGKTIFAFDEGVVHLYDDAHKEIAHFPFDPLRSALATFTEPATNRHLTRFKRWFDGLLVIGPNPRAMSGVASQEFVRIPDTGLVNFADWYRHVRLAEDGGEYLRDLRLAIDGFKTMVLEPIGGGRHEIKIEFEGEKKRYSLSELSDGQRVLVGNYAALHFAMKPGATICFDEPDNFIALREVQPWLAKVLERTEEGEEQAAQAFVVSHHPELLNRMAFQSGILFERPEGRHVRVREFADSAGTGLTAAELVARGWERE